MFPIKWFLGTRKPVKSLQDQKTKATISVNLKLINTKDRNIDFIRTCFEFRTAAWCKERQLNIIIKSKLKICLKVYWIKGKAKGLSRRFFFCCGAATQRGSWPPHSWGFYITHNDAPQSVGLLWTSDQLVAETSTWQHTIITTDKHLFPRWDSKPRSQQASGRRPTP